MTMQRNCRKENCTVAQTGICMLNNDADTCPERTNEAPVVPNVNVAALVDELSSPSTKPRFPSSLTMELSDIAQLMRKRYCRMVGILGAPDAGKTASLVSLYLLLSHNKLDGFEYADCLTLRAFEDISRGSRRWDQGRVPEQFTSHTRLEDNRIPGFLHLRLRQKDTNEATDLLLPDLPGEWSTSLIDNNRTDRLEFLRSCDVIWLMLDGEQLTKRESKGHALHRAKLLIQRLGIFLGAQIPPVVIVMTRKDTSNPSEAVISELVSEAARYGIKPEIFQIASFASNESGVTPGIGLSNLIEHAIKVSRTQANGFWPDRDQSKEARAMLRFDGSEGGDA